MKSQIVRIFTVLLLMTTPGFAKDRSGEEGHGVWLAQELNLTPEQKEKVKQIKAKYMPGLKERKQAARTAKEELGQALQSSQKGPEYQKTLMEKFKKVQSLKQAQHQYRFEMALEIRELLTAEQIVKFKALHRGHHGKKGRDHHGDDE